MTRSQHRLLAKPAAASVGGLLVAVCAVFLLFGCTNSPEAQPTAEPAPSPSDRQQTPRRDQGGTFSTTTHQHDVRVPRRPNYEIGYNDRGQLQVPQQPPADVPELPIAPAGVEGFYVPTTDYIEQLPYGLLLYRGREELNWAILDDPTNSERMQTLGIGTVREREGGLEFVERSGTTEQIIGIEQFPAQRSTNRFTIRQAGESQGRTAFGEVMRKLGTEVHWVRVAAVDGEANHVYTSPLVGRFNPVTRPTGDQDRLGPDPSRRLAIWPDGVWRMAVYTERQNGETAPTIYGGTWELDGSDRVTFTQALPPEYAVEAPMETYAFVYHKQYRILWLTKLDSAGPGTETAVLPKLTGDTTVYQVYHPRQ